MYRKTSWVRAGDAIGVFLTPRQPGDYVKKGDVLGTVTDPVTEESRDDRRAARRPHHRDGGAAVRLPGYGLFHLGFDPE